MQRTDALEKTLMLGKIEGGRRRGWKGGEEDEIVGWHHQLDGHASDQALGVGDGQGSRSAAVHGVTKNQTRLSDGTTTSCPPILTLFLSPLYFNVYVRLHSS